LNNSSSLQSSSPSTATLPPSPKSTNTNNKNKDDLVTINEKVNLTQQQHQVLKMICDTYQMSFSEYMQQALLEAMRFDIEEGNLSDALLEKIGGDDSKNPHLMYSFLIVAFFILFMNLVDFSIALLASASIFCNEVRLLPKRGLCKSSSFVLFSLYNDVTPSEYD
jgi:hypothetical protein